MCDVSSECPKTVLRIMRNYFALLLLVAIVAVGCGKEPVEKPQPDVPVVEVKYDKEVITTSLEGSVYRGVVGDGGCYGYRVMLSEVGLGSDGEFKDDADYYIFDIYAAQGGDSAEVVIPNGEYLLDEESAMGVGSLSALFSAYISVAGDATREPFSEARIVVEDGAIEAYLTLGGGEKHLVRYEGSLAIPANSATTSNPLSTLAVNHLFDIEDGVFVGAYVGDLMGTGCNTCQVYMWEYLDLETGKERGDIFQIDLQLPRGGTDICGIYTVGDEEGRFIAGWAEDVGGQYMQQNSWYMTADYATFAPLVGGMVCVESEDGMEYTFVVDMVDDLGNAIRGVFRGVGEFTEW